MPRFPSGNRGFVSEDNHMTEPKRAQLHLPGLFEFYEFYRVFCRSTGRTGNIFMIGAKSPRFMARRRAAFGAADAWAAAIRMRAQFWR